MIPSTPLPYPSLGVDDPASSTPRLQLPAAELRGLIRFLADGLGGVSAVQVSSPGVSHLLLEYLKAEVPNLEFVQAPDNLPNMEPLVLVQMRMESTRQGESVYVIPLDGRSSFSDNHEARIWFERLSFQREAFVGGQGRTLFLLNPENHQWLASVVDDLHDQLRFFDLIEGHPLEKAGKRDLESGCPTLPDTESLTDVGPGEYQTLILEARRAVDGGVSPLALLENHLLPWADAAFSRIDLAALKEAIALASVALANLEQQMSKGGRPEKDTIDHIRFNFQLHRGDAAALTGMLSTAIQELDEAFVIAVQYSADNVPWQRRLRLYYSRMGDIRKEQGNLALALENYNRAKAIAERVANMAPDNSEGQRDLILSWGSIGAIRQAQGDLAQALHAYTEGMKIADFLARREPDNSEWQHQLRFGWGNVGGIRLAEGDFEQALHAYTEGMEIAEFLSRKEPDNSEWQSQVGFSWNSLGDIRRAQGDFVQALYAYTEGLKIAEILARKDPDHYRWQRDLSFCWNYMGDVRLARGEFTQALDAYIQAKSIAERLATIAPDNLEWQRDLGISWDRIGDVHLAGDDFVQAIDAYTESMKIAERLATWFPDRTHLQRDLEMSFRNLGFVHKAARNHPKSQEFFRAASNVVLDHEATWTGPFAL